MLTICLRNIKIANGDETSSFFLAAVTIWQSVFLEDSILPCRRDYAAQNMMKTWKSSPEAGKTPSLGLPFVSLSARPKRISAADEHRRGQLHFAVMLLRSFTHLLSFSYPMAVNPQQRDTTLQSGFLPLRWTGCSLHPRPPRFPEPLRFQWHERKFQLRFLLQSGL